MQRNRSHPGHPFVHGFLRMLWPANARIRSLLLSAGIVALTASASQAPDSIRRSCKPLPPYSIEMESTGDSQWTLALRNSASTRQVVVWMWSEINDPTSQRQLPQQNLTRQQAWAGTLQADEFRQLRIEYRPAADATHIWASVESADATQSAPDAPTLRGLAVTPWNQPQAQGLRKTAEITEDPASGRRVEQYVGQGGLQ